MSAYREASVPCPCTCHERLSHRIARLVRTTRWWLAALAASVIGLVVVRACVRVDDANNLREAEAAKRRTFEWREAHEPCRDETDLVGPHAGQDNGLRCRVDQRVETHDVGDGSLITCRCVK